MDPSILLFFGSHHFTDPSPKDNVAEYREFNPGLGLSFENEDVKLSAGYFRNSLDRNSIFVSLGTLGRINSTLGWTASLMAATGYSNGPGMAANFPKPIPTASLYYEFERYRVHFGVTPECVMLFSEIKF